MGVIPHRDRALSDVSAVLLMGLGLRFCVGGLTETKSSLTSPLLLVISLRRR